MTIDELLPDEPANIVHKRILRGVAFRREAGKLVAICENATQGQYVDLVVSQLLLTAARKRFREGSLTECKVEVASTGAHRTLQLVSEGKNVRRVPHPEQSFGIYVPGERNREAVASIVGFAESAGSGHTGGRLLYVYGPNGAGKTHLLEAVVNEWVSNALQAQAYKAVDLLSEISSLGTRVGRSLASHWRLQLTQAPHLAIDDVDVFMEAGMEWTQVDVHMILEALAQTSGYGIVTGSRAPDDKSLHVDPVLAAVFQKAEVVELKAADLSMRRAIAWNCFQYGHVAVADDVLDFIAHSVVDVPRMLLVCHSVSMLAASGDSIGIKTVQSILHRRGVPKRAEDDQTVARQTVAAAIEAMGEQVPLERISGRRLGKELTVLRDRIVVQLVEKKQLKRKMVAEALGISTQTISVIMIGAKERF
ncbi:MAG: DnaA/Hda family protein [Candidatus Cryosericum sp.]